MLTMYLQAPYDFPTFTFDDSLSDQQKYEILNFLYTSLLTKISNWYQGLVACIFGIFSVIAILTEQRIPQNVRLLVMIIGVLTVLVTAFILYKAVSTYALTCIVERSYRLSATQYGNMLNLFRHLNELIEEFFPLYAKVSSLKPKDLTLILGGGIMAFIWPVFFIIIYLYLYHTNKT